MKKYLAKLSMIVFVFYCVNFLYVNDVYGMEISNDEIYIENKEIPLIFISGNIYDVNYDTYVPIREFIGYLGGTVNWNSSTRSIEILNENKQCVLNLSESNPNLIIENSKSYFSYEVLAKSIGYSSYKIGNTIRLFQNDNKDNNKLPSPNPFTPFADSETFLNSSKYFCLDNQGVFIYDYGTRYEDAGKQYNPSFISSYAFSLYRDYIVSNLTDEQKKYDFLKQANWLIDNKVDYGEFDVWEYNFDNITFGAIAPWRSGMANGRVLSVMTKAYALTGDVKYLYTAEKAYRAFLVDTKNYGLSTFLENGTAYYEEVADVEGFSSKVLNGHIFALSGIYDYWKATGREDVRLVLERGVNAVKNDIDLYDAGFLSYYSQKPEDPRLYAPKNDYNTLHVHQLLWLYDISEEEIFLNKAMKFYDYEMQNMIFTTKGSTNPITNGPDNLNLSMGTNYWSHSSFPTWVELDLSKAMTISGISIMGYTQKSSPKELNVWHSIDGQNWYLIKEIKDNKEQYLTINFKPLTIRYIKVDILSDNGNKNVALTGVGVIPTKNKLSDSISNFDNFSAANTTYKINDGNIETGFFIKDDGWLIINNTLKDDNTISKIHVSTGLSQNKGSTIRVYYSDDLSNWTLSDEFIISNKNEEFTFKESIDKNFLKIEYSKDLIKINEIVLKP